MYRLRLMICYISKKALGQYFALLVLLQDHENRVFPQHPPLHPGCLLFIPFQAFTLNQIFRILRIWSVGWFTSVRICHYEDVLFAPINILKLPEMSLQGRL